MERIIKLSILLAVIVLVGVCAFVASNYMIYEDILAKSNEILNSKNYYVLIETTAPETDLLIRNELYCKNDIYLVKTYNHEELYSCDWKNFLNDEDASRVYFGEKSYRSEFDEEAKKTLEKDMLLDGWDIFAQSFKKPDEVNGCYKVDAGQNIIYYFNMETLELVKKEILTEDFSRVFETITYKVELNNVTDENVEKPV